MKSKRQSRILELVSEYELETQEDITLRLRQEGYAVTQATVSRDLKDLKLAKTMTEMGTYRYTVGGSRAPKSTVRPTHALTDSISRVEYAQNAVVVHTDPGLAQAVASAVDGLNMHAILGCVAGDDTIIIVTRNEEGAEEVSKKIREWMKPI